MPLRGNLDPFTGFCAQWLMRRGVKPFGHSLKLGQTVVRIVALGAIVAAPALMAQVRPRGIYAVADVENEIAALQAVNPSITAAQLDAGFNSFYQSLLSNPAVAGLAIRSSWATLNPNPAGAANAYSWSLVDDGFNQAAAWNAQNPAKAPKTIQLIVTPGFGSPQWLLNQIPSCDSLFKTPVVTPPSTCGTATFTGFSEGGNGDVLPLPWNPAYKSAWRDFLTAVAGRYGSNPLFASIAVTGPTAASAEMNLPHDGNSNNPQTQFGAPITPSNMWIQLQVFHYPGQTAYQKTDQAFIDEWNNAIDLFGQMFSGVTLVVTTGNGFPNFTGATITIPPAFAADCANNPSLACAAATTILQYFMQPGVGGANAKATQDSGFAAARVANDLGVPGVKQLSQVTAHFAPASAQVLGGSQFSTTFSIATLTEGCTAVFPPNASDTPAGCVIPPSCNSNNCVPVECIPQACLAQGVTPASIAKYNTTGNVPAADLISPEQALYNLLNVFFDGTGAATSFGGTPGVAPLNYLQIYPQDIQYATMNANAPAQVVEGSVTASVTAQASMNLASAKLLTIGEPSPSITGVAPVGSPVEAIQPGEWVSIFGSNFAGAAASWTGSFPTSLAGTSVTIDGKPAYLSYVSPTQINVQAPVDSATGSVSVVVTAGFGTSASNVTLAPVAPSFFLLDAKHVAGIILRSDGAGAYGGGTYDIIGPTGTTLGYRTVAAKAGDAVELFGNGFGPTNPAVPAGQVFSGAAATTNSVTLQINNGSVTPAFAGLSGAGLYQINLTIPPGLGFGDVSLQATVGGTQTPSGVVISLQ
jgi:uncharacterized protein (TIGR03437 family)